MLQQLTILTSGYEEIVTAGCLPLQVPASRLTIFPVSHTQTALVHVKPVPLQVQVPPQSPVATSETQHFFFINCWTKWTVWHAVSYNRILIKIIKTVVTVVYSPCECHSQWTDVRLINCNTCHFARYHKVISRLQTLRHLTFNMAKCNIHMFS